jgi:multiple sugar transport system substrate-binding protein
MKTPPLLPQIKSYFCRFFGSGWQISILGTILSLCLLLSGCQGSIHKGDSIIHLTLWQGINPPVNRDVFQKLVNKFNN